MNGSGGGTDDPDLSEQVQGSDTALRDMDAQEPADLLQLSEQNDIDGELIRIFDDLRVDFFPPETQCGFVCLLFQD